jgi:hypothetical protein
MPQNLNTGNALLLRSNTVSTISSWDVVEDLPLRWATDYVGLAAAGSRLLHTSVVCYALWRDRNGRGLAALLAVATKSNILLYEKPKGERAFRFVKVSRPPSAYDMALKCVYGLGILYATASPEFGFYPPVCSRYDSEFL